MGAQIVFEIDLEILGELSQVSVLRAVQLFIDKQIGRSSEFEVVETAFRYYPPASLSTKLIARGVAAIRVSAGGMMNVFAVGNSSMISLLSMTPLFACEGKFQAYHDVFLIADH